MTEQCETLALLGLTKEQLQERVVERIAREILDDDNDGHDSPFRDTLEEEIAKHVKETINTTVRTIGDRYIAPHVTRKVEELVFQETTRWGEKVGEPMSFIEYLISRVEHYMTEEVNWNGEPRPRRGEYSSSSWKAHGTRIATLMDRHLHHEISVAMVRALKNANSVIAEGITKTVKLQLGHILEGINCAVTVKS